MMGEVVNPYDSTEQPQEPQPSTALEYIVAVGLVLLSCVLGGLGAFCLWLAHRTLNAIGW